MFGEPVAFEEEQPQQTRFRDCLIAAIFLLFCLLPLSGPASDPHVRHLHLWPANRWFVGIGVGKNAALGNVVISLFFMLGVFRRCCG